jgi:purine-nucleoside phosphorylase
LTTYDAIVNPIKSKSSPDIGPVAVMAATRPDLYYLCQLLNFSKDGFQRLFMSRLYFDRRNPGGFSVVGPFVGAPYAVMLLETLIAWGVRQIIFVGWCGAVSEKVKIGDVILPTSVFIDEGTSKHYGAAGNSQLQADFPMLSKLRQMLNKNSCDYHEGTIWTTDAIYRETSAKIKNFQKKNVLAVEMETSSLFTVAKFREVDLGAILVVSDELSSLKWKHGFKSERFRIGRHIASGIILELCRIISND